MADLSWKSLFKMDDLGVSLFSETPTYVTCCILSLATWLIITADLTEDEWC